MGDRRSAQGLGCQQRRPDLPRRVAPGILPLGGGLACRELPWARRQLAGEMKSVAIDPVGLSEAAMAFEFESNHCAVLSRSVELLENARWCLHFICSGCGVFPCERDQGRHCPARPMCIDCDSEMHSACPVPGKPDELQGVCDHCGRCELDPSNLLQKPGGIQTKMQNV